MLHFLYARHPEFLSQKLLKDAENVHPSMFSTDAGRASELFTGAHSL